MTKLSACSNSWQFEPFSLSAEQIESFHDSGFLVIAQPLIKAAELAWLKTTLNDLFERKAGRNEGALFDLSASEDGITRLPELLRPASFAPMLRYSSFHRTGLVIARQLLGLNSSQTFEHAICKPPHDGAVTAWHQDEAYRTDPNLNYSAITIWMPLQAVSEENGCMRYVRGSHLGEVLQHRPVGGRKAANALECAEDIDAARIVSCPLPAGGITIHHGRTLHGAGLNRSSDARLAYILNFDAPPTPRSRSRRFPWLDELHGSARKRRRSWLLRGGFMVETIRFIRLNQSGGVRGLLLRLKQFLIILRRR